MKQLLLLALLFLTLNAGATKEAPAISPKALHTFHQVFTKATDVKWEALHKKNVARFALNAVTMKAVIDDRGRLLSILRYYKDESLLPVSIRYTIKKKYEDKAILFITDYSEFDETTYFITLQDAKTITNITINHNGDLVKETTYKRGDL